MEHLKTHWQAISKNFEVTFYAGAVRQRLMDCSGVSVFQQVEREARPIDKTEIPLDSIS